ncbi:MAG: DUF433 domain-containing protein [Sporichthyaceae bacterium]
MTVPPPSVQRSFRLARRTADELDAAADASGESRNALADRLLAEALRMERHPLIRFRTGAARRREPMLVGTRLLVRDVLATVRAHGNHRAAAVEYLGVPPRTVDAAIAYYAEHRDEIDADTAWAEQIAHDERARWERQQAALG